MVMGYGRGTGYAGISHSAYATLQSQTNKFGTAEKGIFGPSLSSDHLINVRQ